MPAYDATGYDPLGSPPPRPVAYMQHRKPMHYGAMTCTPASPTANHPQRTTTLLCPWSASFVCCPGVPALISNLTAAHSRIGLPHRAPSSHRSTPSPPTTAPRRARMRYWAILTPRLHRSGGVASFDTLPVGLRSWVQTRSSCCRRARNIAGGRGTSRHVPQLVGLYGYKCPDARGQSVGNRHQVQAAGMTYSS